ncbi:MAG: polyprenyl synthetase family protein [Agathobacter sp.]|nr:polyprenyl synthetase family protein [Agathobacter sp.]
MDFEKQLQEKIAQIEALLQAYLPKEEGYQRTILEAMNYSVMAGGKRLRPMMMQEAYIMFGGTSQAIGPFMAALEMIHTYSLVHDDLPAMDNDLYRRGKKTTHHVYGEAMGILAGDALLNYAYETAAKSFLLEPENVNIGKALIKLSEKAGVYGMVGGQVVDVEAEKKQEVITKEKLDFIHHNKTAALIEAALAVGGILSGASDTEVQKLELVARKIGLAFQIQDDILDVIGKEEVLGKPIGSDARNEKVTYVTYEGIEKSKEDVARLTDEALELLHSLGKEDSFLSELFLHLVNREK